MNLRKCTLLITLGCLLAVNGLAEEKHVKWSWETQLRSQYLGKIGIVFYDKPVMVNEISASYGDFFVSMWNSTGLAGDPYGSTFADEFDLFAGWGHTYDWVRVQALGAFFFINDLEVINNDIYAFEVEVSFPKVPVVQPFVAVRSFHQVSSVSPERGWFGWAGLRRLQPLGFKLGEDDVNLRLEWLNGYSDGALAKTPGPVFTRLTAAMPVAVTKQFSVTPSVLYQVSIGGQKDFARPHTTKNELTGIISLKYAF